MRGSRVGGNTAHPCDSALARRARRQRQLLLRVALPGQGHADQVLPVVLHRRGLLRGQHRVPEVRRCAGAVREVRILTQGHHPAFARSNRVLARLGVSAQSALNMLPNSTRPPRSATTSSSWWSSTSGEAAHAAAEGAPLERACSFLLTSNCRPSSAVLTRMLTASISIKPTKTAPCRNASTLDATNYWIGVWNPSTGNSSTFYFGDLQFMDGRILPKSASRDPYAHW
jgi:hypothetical protein